MSTQLDQIFHSLADGTRRDILERISLEELSVSDIAHPYDMSLAAVSKHLSVLENANLIKRKRQGKKFMLRTRPRKLKLVDNWIQFYRKFWKESLDKMDSYLTSLQKGENESDK